jgi:PKD repeat protein
MGNHHTCLVVGLCCVAITILGCRPEIGKVTIEMLPNHGCAPLQVQLIGQAETRTDITGTFSWTIGKGKQLHGARVAYTFATPGAYDIALTVRGTQHTKTRVVTIQVGEAELPGAPGLYLQHACAYRALKEVEEQKIIKQLGKTSLEDLEQRIVRRKLSTPELLTHPLWRREHTHTVYTVGHDQFVKVPLDRFHSLGFVIVGEDLPEVSLFRILPSPEPASTQPQHVITRIDDSWGLESVAPEPQALVRTRLAENVLRYVPHAKLPEGLYFIAITSKDKASSGIRPVELVASSN